MGILARNGLQITDYRLKHDHDFLQVLAVKSKLQTKLGCTRIMYFRINLIILSDEHNFLKIQTCSFRSSHSQMFNKTRAPKILANFTGKDLSRSLFFIKVTGQPATLLKKRLLRRYFHFNLAKKFKNIFIPKHLQATASKFVRCLMVMKQ